MNAHEPAYDAWCTVIESDDCASAAESAEDDDAFYASLFASEPATEVYQTEAPGELGEDRLLVQILIGLCRLRPTALALVLEQARQLVLNQSSLPRREQEPSPPILKRARPSEVLS